MVSEETLILTIDQGKLRGQILKDQNDNNYYSFKGIPYAKPPIGDRRFKNTEAAEPWPEEILDATKHRNTCLAPHMMYQTLDGDEDCLYLNVYTPNLPNENVKKLPVMVWIHGGGLFMGSGNSDMYGPEFLVSKNVVVVTLNYRLGFLGFLSLNNPSLGVTGNMGLKDQVEALRWVQKNIEKFGGDCNNVTLFGESAGGASVHLHLLSPVSKGLFHKAIIQSGAAIQPWMRPFNNTYKLAKAMGCESKQDDEILKFFQNQQAEKFVKFQNRIFPLTARFPGEYSPVSPVIEPNVPGAFLTESAEKLLLDGKFQQIPIIIGVCRDEGLVHSPPLYEMLSPDFKDNRKLVPRELRDELNNDDDAIAKIGDQIKEFYYNKQEPSFELMSNFIQYVTDQAFGYKVNLATRIMAYYSKAPIYSYVVSMNTDLSLTNLFFQLKVNGTCHADDLLYLFNTEKTPKLKANSSEAIGIHRMTTMWTNFAKTSNPNSKTDPLLNGIEWKSFTRNEANYLDIGEKLSSNVNMFKDRMDFWDNIYFQCYNNKHLLRKFLHRCKI